jgi:uncharacterized protein (TIGR03083 family)
MDDRDLAGLDPYDCLDAEAERLARFFASADDATWQRPSRCAGWTVRDVLCHLRADEDYFQANLDGTVQEYMGRLGERGATDLDTANALGVADHRDRPIAEVVAEWKERNAATRKAFRARDGGNVDTAVGAYPARWQAFHLAQELATHADDMGVPVTADEEPARTRWRAAVNRFALKEAKPEITVEAVDGGTRVVVDGRAVTLTDPDFLEAVNARLAEDAAVDPAVRAALAVTP